MDRLRYHEKEKGSVPETPESQKPFSSSFLETYMSQIPPLAEHRKQIRESLEKLLKTQHEAIQKSLFRLQETLREMQHQEGAFPEVIIYPDTSGRILRYAFAPILKALYAQYHQPQPQEVFLKTYSEWMAQDARHGEDMRTYLSSLPEEAVEEHQRIQEDYAHLTHVGPKEVIKKRFHQAFHNSTKNAPVLVLDTNVTHQMRTFRQIRETMQEYNPQHHVYLFALIAAVTAEELQQMHIDAKYFSVGIGSDEMHADPLCSRYGNLVDWNDRDYDWGELYLLGRPYSTKKEAVTGVEKKQFASHELVERSAKSNPALMKAIRNDYKRWGNEAAKNIPTLPPSLVASDNIPSI